MTRYKIVNKKPRFSWKPDFRRLSEQDRIVIERNDPTLFTADFLIILSF